MTAISNDFGFKEIFSRPIKGLCKSGDLVIGLTTSGLSENVLEGLSTAKEMGCFTSLWTSQRWSESTELHIDFPIIFPGKSTPRTQEFHLFIGHMISESVEKLSYELP